jgi:hypothetical protein
MPGLWWFFTGIVVPSLLLWAVAMTPHGSMQLP